MRFKYGQDDIPPIGELFLYGLQWFAIAVPGIIILGDVVGSLHFSTYAEQAVYMQKLSLVTAVTLFVQIFLGHRLPLITGPAAVLLVGVLASSTFSLNTIYFSILAGGLLLALASMTGLFGILQRLFTTRVVAVVLLLIAFTLLPTIVQLTTDAQGSATFLSSLLFSMALLLVMLVGHRLLPGIWRSTLIIWGMLVGSIFHFLLFGRSSQRDVLAENLVAGMFHHLTLEISLDIGVLLSFLICFLALSVNDLGSIQSVGELLGTQDLGRRVRRGITVTGLANMLAGFLGVLGPVNYSLSPGVIATTGCASRFALAPTALLLGLLAFSPAAISVIGYIPSAVTGTIFLYILGSQMSAGLLILSGSEDGSGFEKGLVVGFPVLLGTVVAFFPRSAVNSLPATLQPVLGNGFVVGVTAVLLLEHVIFSDRRVRRGP